MILPSFINQTLQKWVDECIALTCPNNVIVADGTAEFYAALVEKMLADGTLVALNQLTHPGCYLHRSDPGDVARVEGSTFICSTLQANAGPTNNWWAPGEAKARLSALFSGCMNGRTMYVIPYVMGPAGSPHSRIGVEITDSAYVAASMHIMTRTGGIAIEQLGEHGPFVPGLHSVGSLDPTQRYICHFPEESLIWSFGSNYGGNALLGKKCFALRIASAMARSEGWLAEHMLILEISDPTGARSYIAAAFPSACGKTNLAMLIVPEILAEQGWSVRTVGDDIAWMQIGDDGRLWAVNPEAGFFGVAPGTSAKTNPNAMATIARDTIFTNVAVTDDGAPWWEGIGTEPGAFLTDWLGRRRSSDSLADGPFAHANSRFTVAASQCPSLSERWQDPQGVPISALVFGGRRDTTAPLVMQSFGWEHGVFLAATIGSRTTAASDGATNVLRRDPMAMRPFCGYNIGDYFQHWLEIGRKLGENAPAIFQVNWFRRNEAREYIWPGFGQNIRPLIWMLEQIAGTGYAIKSPAGYIPTMAALRLEGLDITPEALYSAQQVDISEWRAEANAIEAFFTTLGDHLPEELQLQLAELRRRLA